MFNIDIRDLDWLDYFAELTKGVRRYLSHEHPKNLPAARRKDKMFVVLVFIYKY